MVCTLLNGFYFKLSFRSGGVDPFFAALNDALEKKLWAVPAPVPHKTQLETSEGATSEESANQSPFAFTDRAGIAGVMRQQQQKEDLAEAMNDINAVMNNAGSLVAAIRKFKSQSGVSQEDASAILSIEEALGLGSVVTSSSVGKGRQWHEEVAREICRWLSAVANPLSRAVVIPLVELFAQYNRARRQELISPHDMLEACRLIPAVMPASTLSLKVFRSGAHALTNDSAGNVEALLRRALGPKTSSVSSLAGLLKTGLSASQFSVLLGATEDIAEEILEDFEDDEILCRSEANFGEVTFFWNIFCLP